MLGVRKGVYKQLNFLFRLDFKITTDDRKTGEARVIHLAAATKQEKLSWITDITQCMDNVHFDNLYNTTTLSAGAAVVPQFVKSDPSLFKDDVDIRLRALVHLSFLHQFI